MKKYNLVRKLARRADVHAIEDDPESTHTVCGRNIDLSYYILKDVDNHRRTATASDFVDKDFGCRMCALKMAKTNK